MSTRRDKTQVIKLYKQHLSYAEVGRLLGISKQRVEQIIKKLNDPETAALQQAKRQWKFIGSCTVCQRPFSDKVHRTKQGLCATCLVYKRLHSKTPSKRIRRLLYPTRCLACQKDITTAKSRCKGHCVKCYQQVFIYRLGKHHSWQKKYYETHRDEDNARSRAYYWANREHLNAVSRERMRAWQERDREGYNAYYRKL